MTKINVSIEGISPLLMNRFRDSQIEGKSKKKGEQKENVVEDKLYLTKENVPYMPAVYLYRSLIDAGKRLQVRGQKKATYSKIVGSVIDIYPEAITIVGDWIPYRISAVNPSTRGRMMVTRPRFEKWLLSFEIVINNDSISADTMNQLLVEAGQNTGVGDWRPEKKGKFGKFIVTRFEEVP